MKRIWQYLRTHPTTGILLASGIGPIAALVGVVMTHQYDPPSASVPAPPHKVYGLPASLARPAEQPTPPPAPPSAPRPSPKPAVAPPSVPASVLNLTSWKLTLPINTAHSGEPDEILQPELATFTSPPYFELNQAKNGVIFRAHAGGATTANSHYPRSELREMNGSKRASWSNASGTHTMTVTQAVTHLPPVKPEVVTAQIHDDDDDVIMVKLSGNRLFVEAKSKDIGDLDANYTLGTTYTVKIVATGGRIFVYYNGEQKVEYQKSGSEYYFKAGCYTQSNPDKGDAPEAFAQVVIYALSLAHT